MMSKQPPYEILGLPLDASAEDVKRQYKRLVRQFPPEQNPEEFASIRAAFDQVNTDLFGKKKEFVRYQRALGNPNAPAEAPASSGIGVLTAVFETPFNTFFEIEKLLDGLAP